MRSTVHLTDRLTNAERRFGSADAYVPVRVKLADGTEAVALMTDAPFLEGIARAQANPEDVERAEAIEALRQRQAAHRARWGLGEWFRREILPPVIWGSAAGVGLVLLWGWLA
jgi:hypothetical protein